MKINNYLSLLFLTLLPFFSNAQINQVDIKMPKHFEYGNCYYSSDIKGLESFMGDLQNDNNEVYKQLLPKFKLLEQKRKQALIVWASGSIVGSSLIIYGFNKELKQMNSTHIENEDIVSTDEGGVGFIAAGGIVVLSEVIIGAILYPGENDIYEFINNHNRINKDKKLDWKIGLIPTNYGGMGVALSMRF